MIRIEREGIVNKSKLVSTWTLVTGILIALIGITHSSFTPMFYRQLLQVDAFADKAAGFIYFFAFMGFAIFFAGLLIVYAASGLKRGERWAWVIAQGSNGFVFIGGVCAIIFGGFTNPLIYIISAAAVLNFVMLLLYHRK